MAAWKQDEPSRTYLSSVKDNYSGDDDQIRNNLEKLIHHHFTARINAETIRQPYFDKYPDLRGLTLALFRVRYLKFVYDVDVRHVLTDLYSLDELRALSDKLQQDTEALRVLSTYAINYIYLVDYILFPSDERPVTPSVFLELGRKFTTNSPEEIQLLIYFYTHCIISAANFYLWPIDKSDLPAYQTMLQHLEDIIKNSFDQINLDNKFEFLVCCRIVGFDSPLFSLIYEEAERSVSTAGTFTVDTLNSFKQSHKTSFGDSEHRNVLFILSTTPYSKNSPDLICPNYSSSLKKCRASCRSRIAQAALSASSSASSACPQRH